MQSKMLATIILDVPITFDPDALLLSPPDTAQLMPLLEELEFRTLARRIMEDIRPDAPAALIKPGQQDLFAESAEENYPQTSHESIASTPHQYHLVSDQAARKQLISKLKEHGSFCFDTETTGLDPFSAEIIGISFAIRPHEAWFVTVPENEGQEVVEEFRGLFSDDSIEKTGQNLKFDISMLKRYSIEVNGRQFDTMLAHYLLQPELRHNLDFLAETYLQYSPVSFAELTGNTGKKNIQMRNIDLGKLKEYACEDADITLQLRMLFEKELEKADADSLFSDVEMPLVGVLAAMEAEGVRIDPSVLDEYSKQLSIEIYEIENQVYEIVGERFNIGSPKQLGEVLFDRLRIIEKPKKTRTQQYSTSEDILSQLVHKHPVIPLILDFRSLTKLKSTYVDTLPQLIHPATGRIHTSYNQAVTATGRLSSTNPNLQNIPIRTELGREIRKAFVPRDDEHILLAADYSQIELRIIASLSGDENMMEAFRQGLDIHAATAAGINKVPLDAVTRDMRRYAKTVNFGIIYGISAFGLADRLGIPKSEASGIITEYFRQYPGIRSYMLSQVEKARRNGYVETILNRRRYLRDINSSNAVVRGFAERNAINAPIQGSSADMIKVAMIRIHNDLKKYRMKTRMILQVHDELVFDAHRNEAGDVRQLVVENMIKAIPLKVPVEVDVNTGENWLEAH
jgi:DNA polymerase-1